VEDRNIITNYPVIPKVIYTFEMCRELDDGVVGYSKGSS